MFDCDDDGMIQVKLPEFSVTRFGDIHEGLLNIGQSFGTYSGKFLMVFGKNFVFVDG